MNVTRSSMDEDPPSWPRTPVDFESLNPHHSETRHEQTTETLNYDRVQSETTYRVDYIKKSGVISPPRERPVLSPSPPLHSETTYKKEYCPKTYTLSPSKERPVLPTSPPLDAATSYRTEFEKPFVASPRKSKPVIATGPPLEGSTSYRTEYTEKPSIISPRRERPILAASNPASSETEYRVQYVNKSPNRSHATVTSMDVPQSIPPEYDLHTQANQDILNVTSSITPTVSTNTSTYKFDYTEKSLVDNYSLPRYIIPTSPKSNSTNATNSGLKTTVDSPPLQQNLPTTLETPITPSKPVSTETAQETNRPTTTTMDTEPTHSLPEKYHGPTDHGLTSPLNSSYQQHFSNPSPETQAAIERRDWTSYYQNNKYHGPTDHNMEASTSSSYRSDYTAPQVASVIGSPRCKSPTLPRYKSPTDHGHVANTKTTYSEHFTPPKSSKNEESVESLAVIEPVVESPAPVEVAVDEASLGIAKRLYQSAADLVAAGRRYFTQYADPPPQHPTKINKSNRSSISASSSVEKPTKQNTTTGRVPRTSSIETMTTYRRDFSPPPSHIKPTASELQPQRLQVTSPPRARSTTENKPVRIKPEDLPPAGKPRYNIQPRFTSPVRPVHEATNRNDITPKKPTQDS